MHENLVLVLIPLERNSVNLIQLELKELAYFTVFYTLLEMNKERIIQEEGRS